MAFLFLLLSFFAFLFCVDAYNVIVPVSSNVTQLSDLVLFHPSSGKSEVLGSQCYLFVKGVCVSPILYGSLLEITPRVDWMCASGDGVFAVLIKGKTVLGMFRSNWKAWCDPSNIIYSGGTDTSWDGEGSKLLMLFSGAILLPFVFLCLFDSLQCWTCQVDPCLWLEDHIFVYCKKRGSVYGQPVYLHTQYDQDEREERLDAVIEL
jgi:hypothetical protein